MLFAIMPAIHLLLLCILMPQMVYGEVLSGQLGLQRYKEEMPEGTPFDIVTNLRQPNKEYSVLQTYGPKGLRAELHINMKWDAANNVYSSFSYQLFDRHGEPISELEEIALPKFEVKEGEIHNIVSKSYGRKAGSERHLVSFNYQAGSIPAGEHDSKIDITQIHDAIIELENHAHGETGLIKAAKGTLPKALESSIYYGTIATGAASIVIPPMLLLQYSPILCYATMAAGFIASAITATRYCFRKGVHKKYISKSTKHLLQNNLQKLKKMREELWRLLNDVSNQHPDEEDILDLEEDMRAYFKHIESFRDALVTRGLMPNNPNDLVLIEENKSQIIGLIKKYHQQNFQFEAGKQDSCKAVTPFNNLNKDN